MSWVVGFLFVGLLSLTGGFGMVYGICSSVLGILVLLSFGGGVLWMSLAGDLLVDQISYLMVFLVLLIFYMSLVSSFNDFKVGSNYFGGVESGIFFVSVFSGMFFVVGSWMNLFFLYEMALLPTLWLILKWGYQPERLQAGVMLMVYAVCSSLPMMVSLVLMSKFFSSDSFLLASLFGFASGFCEKHYWAWFFIFFAFLVKVPVFLVHSWLPKAHVEAPLSASMILAGVLLKLGVFGLIRFIWVLEVSVCEFLMFIILFSVWGGVLSSLICVCQNDIKSLVAYSSIGHMSFAVAAVMTLSELGETVSVLILFAHGVCSPCLFSLAACSYDLSESRSVILNKGTLSVFPLLSGFWFIMSVANMGCPPSLNFFGEVFSVSAVFGLSSTSVIALVLMCFLGGVYCLFLYSVVNHGSFSVAVKSTSGLSERYFYCWFYCFVVIFGGFIALDYFLV